MDTPDIPSSSTPVNPSPEAGLAGTSHAHVDRVPFDPTKWTLVWSDEFDQPGQPDPKTWVHEEGYLRNKESQYYTRGRMENARVEKGHLIIEARRDSWNGHPITSASLTTKAKRSFLYGRIAVRAKLPTGRGTWPAIWTLGDNHSWQGIPNPVVPHPAPVNWPECGEIDILENVGFNPRNIHANVHCAAYNHSTQNGKGAKIEAEAPWNEFHEYAVEWYEDRLEFFFDDLRYFIFPKESDDPAVWPFAQPHALLLCLAIGGIWGGWEGVDEDLFPHQFVIDYVRHYQLKK